MGAVEGADGCTALSGTEVSGSGQGQESSKSCAADDALQGGAGEAYRLGGKTGSEAGEALGDSRQHGRVAACQLQKAAERRAGKAAEAARGGFGKQRRVAAHRR